VTQIRIPPLNGTSASEIQQWARQVSQAVEKTLAGLVADINASPIRSYEVDGLPDPTGTKRVIFVSDETGGAVLAFNDGTNWRRCTDRNIVE